MRRRSQTDDRGKRTEKLGLEDASLLALKIREGERAVSQEPKQAASGSWKGQGNKFSPGTSIKSGLLTLDL